MEEVLAGSFLQQLPARLIGDKAFDSDALDEKIAREWHRDDRAAPGADVNATPRMHARCAASADDGRWNACLGGCTTSADSSPDGNATSRTSSDSSISPACVSQRESDNRLLSLRRIRHIGKSVPNIGHFCQSFGSLPSASMVLTGGLPFGFATF